MSDTVPTIQQFDFSVNLLKSLLWEYNTATNLQALLSAKQAWYDDNQTAFWNDWIINVFDIRTVNDFGCIVWAIILGIATENFNLPNVTPYPPWGFNAPHQTNFNGLSNFSPFGFIRPIYTTAEKRMILQLRYRKMIGRGTIPELNKVLSDIIAPIYGDCYIADNLNMTITFTMVVGSIDPVLHQIFTDFDVIAVPAGVEFIF